MKKYLIIEMWNGEGYSNSTANILVANDIYEAIDECKYRVNRETTHGRDVTIGELFANNNFLGIGYEMGDDAGFIGVREYNEENDKCLYLFPDDNSVEVYPQPFAKLDEVLYQEYLVENVDETPDDENNYAAHTNEGYVMKFRVQDLKEYNILGLGN